MSLQASIKRKIKLPKNYLRTKTTTNYNNDYNDDANSQTDLLGASSDDDENRQFIVRTYCFGFIKRTIPVKFRSLKKIAMTRKKNKRDKSHLVEDKVQTLTSRADAIDREITEINRELATQKIKCSKLEQKDKTIEVKSAIKQIRRDMIKNLHLRKEKTKRSDMIHNSLNQLVPIVLQNDSITDLQLITEAMKAAGQVNTNLKTDKMIRDAQKASDALADISITQDEIDDAILPSSEFESIDISDELDEFMDLKPKDVSSEKIKLTPSLPREPRTDKMPLAPIIDALPKVPSHNHPRKPEKPTFALAEYDI